MSATLKRVYGPAIPGAPTTCYTVPAGKRLTVKQILFSNSDVNPRPISVGVNGVVAAQAVAYNKTIQPNGGTDPMNLTLVLEAGETLVASQGGAFITVTISGVLQDA